MTQYIKEILSLLNSDIRKLPVLFIFFLGMSLIDLFGLSLIGPYVSIIMDPGEINEAYIGLIHTFGLPQEKKPLLIIIGIILILTFVFKTLTALFINKKIIQFAQNQQLRLKKHLMSSYQALPYEIYLKRNSSEYIYSIQQLSVQFGQSVMMPLLHMASDGVVGIVIFCFLAWKNIYALALLLLLLGLMIFVYDRLIRINAKKYGEKANIASTLMLQGVNEGLEGFKEIRILGKEDYFYQAVSSGATDNAYYSAKSQLLMLTPRYLLELSMIFFLVLLVTGVLLLGGDVQTLLPTVAIFGVAALRLLPSSNVLSSGLVKLRWSRDAVSRLYKDVSRLEKMLKDFPERISKVKKNDFAKLALINVSFSYSGTEKKILNNISLEINSGESIGIIGASGVGKTTLIDIMLGLLGPTEGSINFNNDSLQNSMGDWKAQLAYLPQQVFLIDNSISQNITLGHNQHEISEERLNSAIQKARLSELVKDLPKGVNTKIGERGMRLSGGQRQRIALARAFYHGRNVLMMDESTSALDNETEEEIVEEIKNLKGEKTLIVIAHRLTTLRHCDRIYELKDGSIINCGSYSDVIER